MSLQAIEQFAQAAAPGFRCFAAPRTVGPRFLAKVRHILHPPASSQAVVQIRQLLGGSAEQVAEFYQRHDGFLLYRDTLSEAAGIELLPAGEWLAATEEMRSVFEHLAGDPEEDAHQLLTGIALATVPQSGNYFVMPVEGGSEARSSMPTTTAGSRRRSPTTSTGSWHA